MSFWKVTKQSVKEINPILGADFVEAATVLGWKCVVKKGECHVGSEGIYFPIDSQMPADDDRYSFLDRSSKSRRVKTAKFKKQISQGLFIPMNNFTKEEVDRIEEKIQKEGDTDLSEILRVVHYEPPVSVHIGGDPIGPIPEFIRKTDQERFQNNPEFLELLKRYSMEITEKLNGTSVQYYLYQGDFGVCSRNLRLKETENNALWNVAKKSDIESKLRSIGRNISIQGELIGPSIQGNMYGLKEVAFYVFDVWDIDGQRFVGSWWRQKLAESLELSHVPIIDITVSQPNIEFESVVNMAQGKSLIGKCPIREGLVFKCCYRVFGSVPSFKIVSNKYLLEVEK